MSLGTPKGVDHDPQFMINRRAPGRSTGEQRDVAGATGRSESNGRDERDGEQVEGMEGGERELGEDSRKKDEGAGGEFGRVIAGKRTTGAVVTVITSRVGEDGR
jgi:hypothetical protein